MNIDANVQKILFALLRRWQLLVVFALIGAVAGYFYTSHFTTLTYSSEVLYFAYAYDSQDEITEEEGAKSATGDVNAERRTSNTSKMNYVMHMMDTYIAIMQTNEFYSKVADDLNKSTNANYTAGSIAGVISIEPVENTAMFKVTVTTNSPDFSYAVAHQLETTIPKVMESKNSGLVRASVEDKAIKASSAGNLGYPKKCAIGALVGLLLAAAYVTLRTLFDVRVKSSDELTDKYNIPVLGSIPSFETRTTAIQTITSANSANNDKKGDEE
ncbi:MAG: hypothetical protein IJS03_03905 [Eubacterium sp.]|nr:hypothetical protein [Eubacterium sp.]